LVVDIGENHCVLIIEQMTPFDHIEIPNTVGTTSHVFSPISYGDYSGNEGDADNFCPGVNLFPAPFIASVADVYYYAAGVQRTGNPHYYDKRLKIFIPISNTTSNIEYDGIPAVTFTDELTLIYSIRATGSTDVTGGHWTNINQIYDTDKATYSEDNHIASTGDEHDIQADDFYGNNREITDLRLRTKADLEIVDLEPGGPPTFTGSVYLSASDDNFDTGGGGLLTRNAGSGVGVTSTSGSGSDSEYSDYDITGNVMPVISGVSGVTYHHGVTPGGGDVEAEARIYDVYLKITSQYDKTNDPSGAKSGVDAIDRVYINTDGTTPTYTDASGSAEYEPQQIHRDLMKRFAGVNYGNEYMENWDPDHGSQVSPGSYDLEAARSNWKCRLWELSPRPLKDILEQLQFEGCFIFMLVADSDGSGNAGGRYIWVQNTYSSGDVIETFTEDDYTDLNIGHTDVYEVISKSVYDFDRSPVDNSYRQEDEYDNTTDRDNWNLGTSHEERIQLDYLVGSVNATDAIGSSDNTPNESIVLYRDNLQSEPKVMIDFEVINRSKMYVDVGDIIQVNDANKNCYGLTWTDVYFMVVSERRTKQGLQLTCREVYRS
jgi:hypothetical protein